MNYHLNAKKEGIKMRTDKMTGEVDEEQELALINLQEITKRKAVDMPSKQILNNDIDWV